MSEQMVGHKVVIMRSATATFNSATKTSVTQESNRFSKCHSFFLHTCCYSGSVSSCLERFGFDWWIELDCYPALCAHSRGGRVEPLALARRPAVYRSLLPSDLDAPPLWSHFAKRFAESACTQLFCYCVSSVCSVMLPVSKSENWFPSPPETTIM